MEDYKDMIKLKTPFIQSIVARALEHIIWAKFGIHADINVKDFDADISDNTANISISMNCSASVDDLKKYQLKTKWKPE